MREKRFNWEDTVDEKVAHAAGEAMVRTSSASASAEEGEEELGPAHTDGGKLKWQRDFGKVR